VPSPTACAKAIAVAQAASRRQAQKRTNAKGIPSGKSQEPNMLPPTFRATPAFGSGPRAGTELSLQVELAMLPSQVE